MNQDKHQRLGATGHFQAVHAAAVRFNVGVDEVIHAGKARKVASGARSAFASLDPDVRQALSALEWPWTCPGCQGDTAEIMVCKGCGAKGCEACMPPERCGSCRKGEAASRAIQDQKAEQRRAAEARRAKEEAEAAAASAAITARKAAAAEAGRRG